MWQVIFGIAAVLGVIGIPISIAATRHYTLRSIRKRLVIYLDGASSVFRDVDPDVRNSLQLSFAGRTVEELWHVELIVTNEGETAIRDCIEPLTLPLNSGVELLDAAITVAYPEDLGVRVGLVKDYREGRRELQFHFPLLNKGEWFRVKLLLDGSPEPMPPDWIFRIRAEDLPPQIKVRQARIEYEDREGAQGESKFTTTPGLIAIGCLALGLAIYQILMLLGIRISPLDESLDEPITMGILLIAFSSILMFLAGLACLLIVLRRVRLRVTGPPQEALMVGRFVEKANGDKE